MDAVRMLLVRHGQIGAGEFRALLPRLAWEAGRSFWKPCVAYRTMRGHVEEKPEGNLLAVQERAMGPVASASFPAHLQTESHASNGPRGQRQRCMYSNIYSFAFSFRCCLLNR